MFLQYIVSREKEELISRIFWAQAKKSVKNDWSLTVKQVLEDFGINYSFEEIQGFSKARFKALVKEKLNEKALLVLNSMKEDKF